ncbi:MAG: hypothetical protein HYX72_10385 [Acidobacteria bacterium]|nr:hypothetical protein [Acidobacteriota bacterium]
MPLTGKTGLLQKPHRWACALALVLFAFQLIRFYVVIPVDNQLCMPAHDEHGLTSGEHNHSHSHHHEATTQPDTEENYFQHCKDELTALTSIQLFGALVHEWRVVEHPRWIHFSLRAPFGIDAPIPPPFEPPRTSL